MRKNDDAKNKRKKTRKKINSTRRKTGSRNVGKINKSMR
jgi:hypothetical protein